MNNHSFVQSFIPLFSVASHPLLVLFPSTAALKCLKVNIDHFLHVDKINSQVSDCISRDLSAALNMADLFSRHVLS